MFKIFPILILALTAVGCRDNHFKTGKYFAGGVYASAEQLNIGKSVYTEYCMACHGVDGKGNGVSSKGLVPPPRNFTLGLYKFGKVVAGELPHDGDMIHIIQHGLNGSAMFPWDISDDQANAVWQYIKTFAPDVWEGKDKELGEALVAKNDPFGLPRKSFAIQKGKEVYHGVAQCQSCHRAYVSKQELSDINFKYNEERLAADDFDEDMYDLKLQDSDHNYRSLPPDFTWHWVRSAQSVEDIYVRLLSGVNGSGMPSWKDTITDEEIWAVSYYVKSLMDLKDSRERETFINSIEQSNNVFEGSSRASGK